MPVHAEGGSPALVLTRKQKAIARPYVNSFQQGSLILRRPRSFAEREGSDRDREQPRTSENQAINSAALVFKLELF